MSEIRFTKDHEWIHVDGGIGTVGITDYAQSQLGDVVFVELPEAGRNVTQGGEAAVVESVKAASEVYSPVAGTVVESNGALADKPGLINEEPEAGAWMFKLRLADPGQLASLMDRAAYETYLSTL
ncbi:MAG: glycine cleavage system protein GcvH [Magnetospirillum sp.]|nr:glycine cleavage system protein GcvH [Magnetospirillum sp.]